MTSVRSEIAKNCFGGYLQAVPVSAFGQNVKRLRLALDPPLNGKEFAKAIGAGPSMVTNWEKGKTGLPEGPTLIRLAKTLRVSVDDLLVGVDEEYDAITHAERELEGTNTSGLDSGVHAAPHTLQPGGTPHAQVASASRVLGPHDVVRGLLSASKTFHTLADDYTAKAIEFRTRGEEFAALAGARNRAVAAARSEPAPRDRGRSKAVTGGRRKRS